MSDPFDDNEEEESQAVSSLTATPKSMKSVDLKVFKNLHDENNDQVVEEVEESQGASSSSSKTSLKKTQIKYLLPKEKEVNVEVVCLSLWLGIISL